MHDAVLVHPRHTLAQLVHEALDDVLRQRVRRSTSVEIHVLLEVGVEVLEDKVQNRLAVLLIMLNAQKPVVKKANGR